MSDQNKFSPFLLGESIYLREVRSTDVTESYYCWMNDPEVTRYLESKFFPNDMDSLRQHVQKISQDRQCAFLAILRRDTEQHIGNIKIGPIDWIHRLADVGVLIGDKDCWGKGYATEAIGLIIKYAFKTLNLHKLTAGCYVTNKGSAKAFLNNGFVEEGLRTRHRFCGGRYVDTVIFGLLNADAEETIS